MSAVARKTGIAAGTPDGQTDQIGRAFHNSSGEIPAHNARQRRYGKAPLHIRNIAWINSASLDTNPDLVRAGWSWIDFDHLQNVRGCTEPFDS